MCDVPVFYATTEGQTRRIAERVAAQIEKHGFRSRAIAVGSDEARRIDWSQVRGAAVGASLHMQKHQADALTFARAAGHHLSGVPSLFFSVSLAAASKNASSVREAERLAREFGAKTGWLASRVESVAGRLAYTRYNWFVRKLMQHNARKEGASDDTSRDHEFTDWQQVERMADDLAYRVRRAEVLPSSERWFPHAAM